jgi:hypothetical protein
MNRSYRAERVVLRGISTALIRLFLVKIRGRWNLMERGVSRDGVGVAA